MKHKRKIFFCVFSFLVTVYAQTQNPHSVTFNTEYNVPFSIDAGSRYLSGWDELTPIITTYIDHAGSVSICSVDSNARETYIYEYSQELVHIKTIKVANEFEKFGAFVKDDEGNYYLFFAGRASGASVENMALVKYDNDGNIIKTMKLRARTPNSFDGVRNPFYAGSCRMELSGSMLAIYFARQRFDGHQASYGFVLDKDSFERFDRGHAYYYTNGGYPQGRNLISFTGHSFNQFIFPIDNGFIFVDQGDKYPRAFTFGRFQDGINTKRLNAFRFKQSRTYQYTFAQLGGLAKTSGGYIFAGTYEKNRVVTNVSHNDSRNLFVLTFDDNMTSCGDPVWITNYTDKNTENAANPKIASLEGGRYILMWEQMIPNNYTTTFMKIIDEEGNPLGDATELPGIHLNINDVLRYNRHNRKVYWAVNDGRTSITVYALEAE